MGKKKRENCTKYFNPEKEKPFVLERWSASRPGVPTYKGRKIQILLNHLLKKKLELKFVFKLLPVQELKNLSPFRKSKQTQSSSFIVGTYTILNRDIL